MCRCYALKATAPPRWSHWPRSWNSDLTSLLNPLPAVPNTLHLYHCDHLGTPLGLVTPKGGIEWQTELDAWGNGLNQRSARKLSQPVRLQGQIGQRFDCR